MAELTIVQVPIADLKEAEYNPREATKEEFLQLRRSLEQFGFVEPIVVNQHAGRENTIVGGHFRVRVAKEMGLTEVPVVYVDLDEAQEKELNLRLNKNSGHWDMELLVQLDQPLLLDVGFTLQELDFAINKDIVEDEAPEPRPDPNVKLGDLFQLGNHRLLCGDATKKEDVSRLMDGQKADMVFTDPPYGVSYEGGSANKVKREQIVGDDTPLYKAWLVLRDVFAKQSAPFYIWYAGGNKGRWIYDAVDDVGLTIRSQIIWNKLKPHFGAFSAQYKQRHEPCLYCVDDSPSWYGPTNEHSVWDIDQPRANELHPTQKPVALPARAITNSSESEDIVLDLFGGSGSTLIACEQLNRKCYMMEIDPQYVRVIIDRWEKHTGEKAVKVEEPV